MPSAASSPGSEPEQVARLEVDGVAGAFEDAVDDALPLAWRVGARHFVASSSPTVPGADSFT